MERNVLVDKLKGYACFLVLFGHVIMGVRLTGVDIPQFFESLEKFIWSFHVALFMFLSGVVYKETGGWKTKKTKLNFIIHKLLNLGIPYVVFSVVYIVMNSFVSSANTNYRVWDILNIWKTPVAQYWFLHTLFFLFVIWALLGGIFKNWMITVIAVALGYVFAFLGVNIGDFYNVFYFAIAFGLGTVVDFSRLIKVSVLIKCLIVLLHIIAGVVTVAFGIIEETFVKEVMLMFGIYSSIMFISLLQDIKPISKFLLFINKYSFQIYLLHTIFTAGIRIVLIKINVTQWWIHVILGTVCGIVFSVLASMIANKTKLLNIFFFPIKTYKILLQKGK